MRAFIVEFKREEIRSSANKTDDPNHLSFTCFSAIDFRRFSSLPSVSRLKKYDLHNDIIGFRSYFFVRLQSFAAVRTSYVLIVEDTPFMIIFVPSNHTYSAAAAREFLCYTLPVAATTA
jgi:hypothetical protein